MHNWIDTDWNRVDDNPTSSHDNLFFFQRARYSLLSCRFIYACLLYVVFYCCFPSIHCTFFNDFFFSSWSTDYGFLLCRNYRCAESVNMRAAAKTITPQKNNNKITGERIFCQIIIIFKNRKLFVSSLLWLLSIRLFRLSCVNFFFFLNEFANSDKI